LTRRLFAYFSQPTDPGHPTSKVVKTSVFAISRNPLHLASVIVFVGFDLTLNMFGEVGMLLLSIITCHYVLIIPEAKYLADIFGEEYKEYIAFID
jgi:protein-S-isoprenylcysteine O-methyltransferase Ste14